MSPEFKQQLRLVFANDGRPVTCIHNVALGQGNFCPWCEEKAVQLFKQQQTKP